MGLFDYKARLRFMRPRSYCEEGFYDPTTGSFIQPDSLVGGNRYAYVNNNPINFNDPSGHDACDEEGNCYNRNGNKYRGLQQGLDFPEYSAVQRSPEPPPSEFWRPTPHERSSNTPIDLTSLPSLKDSTRTEIETFNFGLGMIRSGTVITNSYQSSNNASVSVTSNGSITGSNQSSSFSYNFRDGWVRVGVPSSRLGDLPSLGKNYLTLEVNNIIDASIGLDTVLTASSKEIPGANPGYILTSESGIYIKIAPWGVVAVVGAVGETIISVLSSLPSISIFDPRLVPGLSGN